MDKQQAFNIVKQAIDAAIKGGVFPNLDTVISVNNALSKLIEPEMKNDDSTQNRV